MKDKLSLILITFIVLTTSLKASYAESFRPTLLNEITTSLKSNPLKCDVFSKDVMETVKSSELDFSNLEGGVIKASVTLSAGEPFYSFQKKEKNLLHEVIFHTNHKIVNVNNVILSTYELTPYLKNIGSKTKPKYLKKYNKNEIKTIVCD